MLEAAGEPKRDRLKDAWLADSTLFVAFCLLHLELEFLLEANADKQRDGARWALRLQPLGEMALVECLVLSEWDLTLSKAEKSRDLMLPRLLAALLCPLLGPCVAASHK